MLLEPFEIGIPGVFFEVTGEADLATGLGIGLVITDVVELLQTVWCDDGVAVGGVLGQGGCGEECLVGVLRLAAHGGTVRLDLAKASGGLDHVDVRDQGIGDGILQGA